MTLAEALRLLHQRGATLAVDGDRLRVRPSQALDEELRAAITQHKRTLLPLVTAGQADVYWRVEIMREQATGRTSIPFLVVRRTFSDVSGLCMSCDGPLDASLPTRCTACVHAVKQVSDEFIEDIQQKAVVEQPDRGQDA